MIIVGADPGFGGGLAAIDTNRQRCVSILMPTIGEKKQKLIDAKCVAEFLSDYSPDAAVIEKVTAMKGWGSGSTFRFGTSFGILIGTFVSFGAPVTLVTPRAWKKHFGLDSDKYSSRVAAMSLFPDDTGQFTRVKDDGRAEAALMAHWLAGGEYTR